jgi:hypothetical protein
VPLRSAATWGPGRAASSPALERRTVPEASCLCWVLSAPPAGTLRFGIPDRRRAHARRTVVVGGKSGTGRRQSTDTAMTCPVVSCSTTPRFGDKFPSRGAGKVSDRQANRPSLVLNRLQQLAGTPGPPSRLCQPDMWAEITGGDTGLDQAVRVARSINLLRGYP